MPDRVALGDPIEVFTRHMFTQIIRKLSAFLVKSDFSMSEVAALHVVGRAGGVSVQKLSEELHLSISATSRLVSKLVRKGFFTRKTSAEDARARVVACSRKGQKLLDDMSLERVSAIFEVVKTLPPQIPAHMMDALAHYKTGEASPKKEA